MSSFKVGDEVMVKPLDKIPGRIQSDDEFLLKYQNILMEVTSVMAHGEFVVRTASGGFREHEVEIAKPLVDLRSIYEV